MERVPRILKELGLPMLVECIDEEAWIKGDYRAYASFDLGIEHFEHILDREAFEYVEGWGPAKGLMCKAGETQFFIMWLEYAEAPYRTTFDFLFPFKDTDNLLKRLIQELNIKEENLSWQSKEI